MNWQQMFMTNLYEETLTITVRHLKNKLVFRLNFSLGSFLPVREDFHPRRNQARQKLATLPSSRFRDLASDVYHELSRRYSHIIMTEQVSNKK